MIANAQRLEKAFFGMFKGRIKKSAQELKDELRKELHANKYEVKFLTDDKEFSSLPNVEFVKE